MKFEYIQRTGSRIPLPQNYKDCIELIRSDYFRYKWHKVSLFRMFIYSIVTANFGFNFWLRLCQYRGLLYPICSFMHRMYMLRYGIQILPETKIGYGLYISHGFASFVNPAATIGNNCNISQCSTIGSSVGKGAVIGDNVYIGPNTCLIDDITVGNSATIGAGAIVTKDVPENSVVAGNPAHIITSKLKPGAYVEHRWAF